MPSTTRMLIVEDESPISKDVWTRLEQMEYHVCSIVSSGAEALKQAEELDPDIVLMDIVLQGDMDGIEAAQEIRSRLDIPVIYLTAHTQDEFLERAKITEPYGYIVKPVEAAGIKAAIQVALYKHGMEKKLRHDTIRRKIVEESLLKSEKQFRTLIKTMHEGLAIADVNFYIQYVNPMMCTILRCSSDELIGRKLTEFMDETNQAVFVDQQQKRKRGISDRYEITLIRKDGNPVHTIGSGQPIFDNEGIFCGSFGVMIDITELKQADEELRKSDERYQTLVRTSMDGFYAVDMDGRILEVNDAYCAMSGYSREALVSMHIADLEYKESPEQIRAHLQTIITQGWDRFETRHRCNDGSVINVQISAVLVTSQSRTG
ncbi:MAG: PAS domain S-box protein [Deltaproteobacteria bacterium]|nr:PAS domain S-box protein [Deltaproteobacteria bacterium]